MDRADAPRQDDPAKEFYEKVEALVSLGRPRIAFGLLRPHDKIVESLDRARQYADIVLVGPDAIKAVVNFEKIIDEDAEQKIASLLATDKVDGIIRGTLDDVKTRDAYARATRSTDLPDGEQYTLIPALLKSPKGHLFFLGSTSNARGWSKEERLEEARGIAEFVTAWGIEPQIAIYSGMRKDTYESTAPGHDIGIYRILRETYEDANWIVKRLKDSEWFAENWTVDLNLAIERGFNIHMPVNGLVGNQIFRMLQLCGGEILAATLVGLSRFYEDNTRTETDFEFHVKWIAAQINKRKYFHENRR